MADYQPDRRGIGELMRTPEMAAALVEIATTEGIPFARSISPDAPPYGEGYVSSFYAEPAEEELAGARRAVARLGNDSRYAMAVEQGWDVEHGQWADHAGYHVLSLTADHLGGR